MSEARCCHRFVCTNRSQHDQPAKRHEDSLQRALAEATIRIVLIRPTDRPDVRESLDLKSWNVGHSLSHVLVCTL